MKGYYKKVGAAKKTFPDPVVTEQYEHPIGPDRPTAAQRFESNHPGLSNAARKVTTFVKERGAEISREAQHQRPPSRTPMQGLPSDAFGMGGRGNPFGGSPFGTGGYGHLFNGSPGPIHDDSAPPRKPSGSTRTIYRANGDVEVIRTGKRASRKKRSRDGNSSSSLFSNPMHIPKGMRHLF